jgi:hypothetical protein
VDVSCCQHRLIVLLQLQAAEVQIHSTHNQLCQNQV